MKKKNKLEKRIEELELKIKQLESRETIIVVPQIRFQEPEQPWRRQVMCEGISY